MAQRKNRTRKAELTRLWKHLKQRENGCWEYEGQRQNDYVRFQNESNKLEYAHRVAYRLMKGSIPAGLLVLHSCDNPKCCNPMHLFLGTHADNTRDKVAKGRHSYGDNHGKAKITDADAIDIYTSTDKGVDLAEEYHVSQQLISAIKNKKVRKHLFREAA